MLNDFIHSQILASARKWLKDTCTITYQKPITDKYGAQTKQPVMVAQDVPCRVIEAGGQRGSAIEQAANQETLVEEYRLAVPIDTALDVDQEVAVGSAVYQIVRLDTSMTDKVFRHAIMVRRR